ncbi:MAG: NAD(P)H-dependent oxidoreductase [Planctomycetes bacterium]|nr:NAD(P)H-dependent oxidoreductase [Planctomycetota bacterium]
MSHLIISCSLDPNSKSALLALALADVYSSRDQPHQLIDLRQFELPFCDDSSCYNDPNVVKITDLIRQASSIAIATPIYNFAVVASTRNLLAVTGNAFDDKVVGILCASGGARSFMAAMGLANSLMLDFRVIVIPRFVFASADSFEENAITDEQITGRITELAQELERISTALSEASIDVN